MGLGIIGAVVLTVGLLDMALAYRENKASLEKVALGMVTGMALTVAGVVFTVLAALGWPR